MNTPEHRLLLWYSRIFAACVFVLLATTNLAQAAEPEKIDGAAFEKQVQPFFKKHCLRCHNIDKITSGVRVDHLDAAFEDRQLRLWKNIRAQLAGENMPPEEEPQPADGERQQVVDWIDQGLAVARTRPTPKNGSTRRLTVAQYRNTLRELLQLQDDFSELLPPDAVSKDGFVNNNETLALSPLLLEAYFEIAEKALDACIVDVNAKPSIQNFRVDLGRKINPQPCPDNLILGANSHLLDNVDVLVTQLTAKKPFPFEPFFMQTKYRFIEGYQGNDTVRGWREYDSIYHAVFACMRGNPGYPKGLDFGTVPEGLLLRPAIPSDEIFGTDNTYGPRANFKISLRELPDHGRFRVTVTAAKYEDGLLLDPGTPAQPANAPGAVVVREPESTKKAVLPQAGVYQVDVHGVASSQPVAPDAARLSEGLIGAWPLNGNTQSAPERKEFAGRLAGDAKFVDSPFEKAISLDGDGDAVVVPRNESMGVGEGEFTVAAWIHPRQLRQAGLVCLGKYAWTHGWYLDMPNNQGVLRIETVGTDNQPNGTVQTPPGTVHVNAWQHVAAIVRRGQNGTQLFVNGYPVAKGTVGPGNLDNPRVELNIGRIQDAHQFQGEIDDVRIYRRALEPAEIQALVEPGRKFATAPPEKPRSLKLQLGSRDFSGTQQQPAFLVARFPAGELPIQLQHSGSPLDRMVFTPLAEDDPLARQFAAFEKRVPRMGVHVGLRRDCGSSLIQVGPAQIVSNLEPGQFVYEGAIRNFPSPDVEKDNVNYLAGVREIGVRSEFTDGRDMPRLVIRSVEFEGPYYESWPPPAHRNIFIDFDRKDDLPAYGRAILRNFATRAYRRPITADEEARLVAVFERSLKEGADFRQSVKDALQFVLTSPQFLFLIEHSHTPEAEQIDDFELASKLSYFLWNSPPDEALLQRAARSELRQSLDAELARMVDDPRFAQFSREFVSQWLSLDKFDVLEPDKGKFPRLTQHNRSQLRQEPVQFWQHLVRENLPVRNLIDSDFVLANEAVASYYGLADKPDTGFAYVPVPKGRHELGGFLSQPAILAGLSNGRESNPVKRGAWLARKIVAEPPDDPPPNVPALQEDTKHLSLRERIERHRSQPGCAQCHTKIDPWGIPFEEFDAGGLFKREKVDARSTLPDTTEVAGIEDLRRYLAEDRIDQVAFSVLKHLTTYATGRSLTYNETEYVRQNGLKLKDTGYRMQDLLRFVVHSPMFLEK